MKLNMRVIGYVLLLAGALFSTASAGGELTVVPLETNVATPIDRGGQSLLTGCQVGNAGPAVYGLPNFIAPPQEYAVTFVAQDVCTECLSGVQINAVHMVLLSDEAMAIEMGATIAAVDSTNSSCPEPGVALCSTSIDQVLLPGAGLWDLSIPIEECPCLEVGGQYALTVIINSIPYGTPGNVPDLVVDNQSSSCTSWLDSGTGWVDQSSLPGNLVIFADADCCNLTAVSVGGGTDNALPTAFRLEGNSPNPFNPTTTIRYALPREAHVQLNVYNMAGRNVMELVNETRTAGSYSHHLDGATLASGVYFYKLTAGNYEEVRKMTLVR